MTETTIMVAMAQMYVMAGQLDANLERACGLIEQAAAQGAQVIVLPECCDIGWTDDRVPELAGPIPGGTAYEAIAGAARQAQIHVVAGLTEASNAKVFNSAVLVSPSGNLLALHRKINVLGIAQHLYSIGDRLTVCETDFGTVGINICADNFDSSLAIADTLCRMGAQVIFSPSAWADDVPDPDTYSYGVKFWRQGYQRVCRHYRVSLIAVSNVGDMPTGPWAGRKAVGCSLAIGPDGNDLAVLRTGWDEDAEELRLIQVPLIAPEHRGTDLPSLFAGQ